VKIINLVTIQFSLPSCFIEFQVQIFSSALNSNSLTRSRVSLTQSNPLVSCFFCAFCFQIRFPRSLISNLCLFQVVRLHILLSSVRSTVCHYDFSHGLNPPPPSVMTIAAVRAAEPADKPVATCCRQTSAVLLISKSNLSEAQAQKYIKIYIRVSSRLFLSFFL